MPYDMKLQNQNFYDCQPLHPQERAEIVAIGGAKGCESILSSIYYLIFII